MLNHKMWQENTREKWFTVLLLYSNVGHKSLNIKNIVSFAMYSYYDNLNMVRFLVGIKKNIRYIFVQTDSPGSARVSKNITMN